VKQFACGDVVPGCDARFRCPTDDDILAAVAAHAAEAHGMTHVPPDVVDRVRSLIAAA
jgi:predicted small metal-binding protein